jgi:hypothetical protein
MSVTADKMEEILDAPAEVAVAPKLTLWQRLNLSMENIVLALFTVAVVVGPWTPARDYINPESGIGYWLGITGGSLMLLLLIYPLRKRQSGIQAVGSVKGWFRAHMMLGIVGPGLVLYHCNFSLGATNSNVALFCMVFVAGSGLVGRYLYARIHNGLYGQRAKLAELHVEADRLRESAGLTRLLPELIAVLDASEKRITRGKGLSRAFRAMFVEWTERRRLSTYVSRALRNASARRAVIADHAENLRSAALRYGAHRLSAARRVAEFEACERLFSLWHVMHIPLFILMIIAAVVHVVAVHVY